MKKLFTLVALLACFVGAKAEWVQDVKQDYSTYKGFPFYVMGYVPEWVDGVMTDYGSDYRYATQDVLDNGDAQGNGKFEDGESIVGTVKDQNGTEYQKVTGKNPYWHQYHLSGNFQTELDGSYIVKAMVKASEACTIDVDCAWNWSGGQLNAKVAIGTEWQEVEWEYNNVGGTECWVTAKPANTKATIEWKYVIVGHNQKASRPTVWQQWLTNDGQPIISGVATESKYMGDAEFGQWPDWALAKDETGVNINWRGERTGEICAWSIVRGLNIDPSQTPDPVQDPDKNVIPEGKPRPFPCNIEDDGTGNHVFVVHSTTADNQFADWQAWDNQFFIMSPKAWKEGDQIKIKFRYKAEKACTTQTQIHTQYPSKYLHWEGIGNVSFTTDWQDFEKIVTFNGSQATGWCVAFNLNSGDGQGNGVVKEPNTFYFDDLSWETMKLDEGYFVAGANPDEGLQYDFDNAIQFTYEKTDDYDYVATVGEKNAYVSEVMISTLRGNDAAFKGNTLKPSGAIVNDPTEWLDYNAATLAKLALPGVGIWKIYLDTENKTMAFEMLEGKEKEAAAIVTNATVVVVKGQAREDLIDEWNKDKQELTVREDADNNTAEGSNGVGGAGHNGQTWDNQFFIVANRELEAKEVTHLKFSYKASKAAKTTTQSHAAPGGYIHWAAIGDVNFTTEWQEFDNDVIIDDACAGKGMKSIAFNMAEIKEACDYEIKDVQWYIKDESLEAGKTWENLIDATGTKNFYVKEGAGTNPHEFTPSTDGISNVVKNAKTSAVIYNLAGQRVSNGFKGIVVKDGKKMINK